MLLLTGGGGGGEGYSIVKTCVAVKNWIGHQYCRLTGFNYDTLNSYIPAVALLSQIPGSQCQASTQCNGFSTSCAQCMRGVCACVNGAASNGASCLQMPPRMLSLARNGCDQYGSPCSVLLSTARRRPIIAPMGNITETPC